MQTHRGDKRECTLSHSLPLRPCRVLVAGLDEAGIEVLRDEDGDTLAALKGAGATRRAAGNMAAMSGAAGMSYLEYGKGGPSAWGKAAKGGAGGGPKAAYQGDKAKALGRKLLGNK